MAKLVTQVGREIEVPGVEIDKLTEDVLAFNNGGQCYIRATPEGDLFDITDATANIRARDKDRTGKLYLFKPCSVACYESYAQFVTSRNKGHLHMARRAFLS